MQQSSTSQPTTQLPPKAPSQQTDPMLAELTRLQQLNVALAIMLWNVVRSASRSPDGQSVIVDNTPGDPLWQLLPCHVEGEPDKVRIVASVKEPPTESDKKRLVRTLRGTKRDLIEVLGELDLQYPPEYMAEAIMAHLIWDADAQVWRSPKQENEG